ncbi:hypothetical protein LRY65_00815 [Candidatus Woesebacteria bacterium]|nr:hypothetical protein [Candidatus Woesebacteria bacterium]MCD8507678.1 hypothetical protein [Candidatus Woesebacteria bacterium]MCD8526739.1 hypothetical protein [Candidatus Woesebacteria bacterium]MCD8546518.1 hypothetical protein [Candidatus Woesebacteria bacterium]
MPSRTNQKTPSSALGNLQEILGIGRREQIVLLGVLALIITTGILIFFRPRTASQPSGVTFSTYEQHEGSISVTFTGSTDVTKNRLALQYITDAIDQETLLRTFAGRLDMQALPSSLTGNTYISADGVTTLTMANGDQGIIYIKNGALSEPLTPVSLEFAQESAEEFLSSLGYTVEELNLIENETQFLGTQVEGSEGFPQVPAAEARIIQLFYEKQLNTVPIAYSASAVEKIAIEITADGVFRANLPNVFISTEPGREYTVISVEKALENIESGQFSIIGTPGRVEKSDRFVRLDLVEQSLQYRYDTSQGILFPMFRFEGTAMTESGELFEMVVVTEAIEVRSEDIEQ